MPSCAVLSAEETTRNMQRWSGPKASEQSPLRDDIQQDPLKKKNTNKTTWQAEQRMNDQNKGWCAD
jgi:hypothetical protein